MKIEELYQIYLKYSNISTDSRKIEKDCLFFALKGANFNGNKYAAQALEKGAAYVVIDEIEYKKSEQFILVEDVLTALQKLANYHRRQFSIPFIGITGSNGKTTTKELISAVLSTTFRTAFTKGNFNNHIGVPLTLLDIPLDTEIAVIEMGANHQKEIAFLCEIAEPTHGVITNIGKAHLEGFGGYEGVKKGKSELYEFLAKRKAIAFVNKGQAHLYELAQNRKVKKIVRYGQDRRLKYHTRLKKLNPTIVFTLKTKEKTTEISSHLFGTYNFDNINTAVTIGRFLGVSIENIQKGIENYIPTNNRSQIVKQGSNTIILDAYNANPTSTKFALENFAKMKQTHKVAILGDMLELGESSVEEHQGIVKLANSLPIDEVIFVGKEYGEVMNTTNNSHFQSVWELKEWFATKQYENSSFLIKGSRGIKLEKLMPF